MTVLTKVSLSANWVQLSLLSLILVAGALLRLIGLTSLPSGLHGDEAILGLEAQRVLREGYIGPYSPSALGQPAGPFYPAAISLLLFGNTIFAVRIFTAVVGILTIPALYFVVRRQLGTSVALISAALFAGMGWHIYYSRIGFPLITWPFWVVLTVGVVAHAWVSRSALWWTLAGIMAGAGIYSYNAHPLALAAIGVAAAGGLLAHVRRDPGAGLIACGSFVGVTVVALIPMFRYAIQHSERYFGRFRRQAAGHDDGEARGWAELVGSAPVEYLGFWYRLCCDPVRDSTDGSGVTETVPLILLFLAAAGLILGLARYRNPLIYLAATIELIMPLAAVFTEGATMRRTFVIAPFLSLFAALAAVEIFRLIAESPAARFRAFAAALLAAVLVTGVATDVRNYFVTWNESSYQRWVFVEPYTDASLYMRDLPDDSYVYFMSARWSVNYETRRFLAPDVQGEDRSERFGEYSSTTDFQPDLTVDYSRGRPVFVLIGDYQDHLPELQRLHPGGTVIRYGDSDEPHFVAYELPRED